LKRPVVSFVFLWIIGYILALKWELSWLSWEACLLFAGVTAVLWVFRVPGRLPVCAVLLVGISMGYYHWNDQRNVSALLPLVQKQEDLIGSEATLHGRLAGPVAVDGDRASFAVEAESFRFQEGTAFPMRGERVQVSLRLLHEEEQAQAAGWQRGDALTLQGLLRSPAPARNFGGFDYRRYLRLHRTHWLMTAKGTDQAQLEPAPLRVSVVQLLRWNDGLRNALAGRMDTIFPERQAGFMKSMLIGLQDDLDPDRFQQFSELGLTHILAISGLNVAVFLGVCIWIMRKLRLTKETYLLISILLLPGYILLTGASPSIVRAGLMAMIALYAVRRGLLKDALHLTAIVAWVMLLWNPYYLLDVGFQLSFLVTIGLIIGVPRVSALLPFSSAVVTNTLSITIVSQLISFPISIYYFNQFSLLSWVANAFLVPLISLVVFPAGLIALAVGLVYLPLGQGIGWLLAWLNDGIFWITDQLQELRMFRMIWPTPSILWIVAYYCLLLLIYIQLQKQKKLRTALKTSSSLSSPGLSNSEINQAQPVCRLLPQGTAFEAWRGNSFFTPFQLFRTKNTAIISLFLSLSSFGLLLYIGFNPDRWYRTGTVQYLDVGQGDSILIRTPQGQHVLIDGGGTLVFRKPGEEWKERKNPYEVGRKLLVPLLKQRGVHQLDMVILTHEDADHSGGMQAVVEQIPIKQFVFNGTYKPNPGVEKLFRTILDLKIPLQEAEQGETITMEPGTELLFLYPLADKDHNVKLAAQQNKQSIVFLLQMSGLRWLFTGDMEKGSELELMELMNGKHDEASATGINAKSSSSPIPIDVLKIAHHGSKTSTTGAWLDYWKPRNAVISVGAMNSYGHPSPEVVQRLQQNNTTVFRTDQMGEVQLKVKGGVLYSRTKLN
jgi:competence protein ComEC